MKIGWSFTRAFVQKAVIHNLRPSCPHRFLFLCLKEHVETLGIGQRLRRWAPGCEIVTVDTVTERAACTVLLAKRHIDAEHPLMIANSDQWVDADIAESRIAKNLRMGNEFYVAPAYNELIAAGKKIVYANVGREYDGMYGLGIPADLARSESFAISRRAVDHLPRAA